MTSLVSKDDKTPSKYNVQIHEDKGLVISDNAQMNHSFGVQ